MSTYDFFNRGPVIWNKSTHFQFGTKSTMFYIIEVQNIKSISTCAYLWSGLKLTRLTSLFGINHMYHSQMFWRQTFKELKRNAGDLWKWLNPSPPYRKMRFWPPILYWSYWQCLLTQFYLKWVHYNIHQLSRLLK